MYLDEQVEELDLSCATVDERGLYSDVFRFDQLQNSVGTGKAGMSGLRRTSNTKGEANECVAINVEEVDSSVSGFVFFISGSLASNFSVIKSADVLVRSEETDYFDHSFNTQGKHNAFVLFALYRGTKKGSWFIKSVDEKANGTSFRDIKPLVQRRLEFLSPDKLIEWQSGADKISLKRDDILEIGTLSRIRVGFTWKFKPDEKAELRSYCFLFDRDGNNTENVFIDRKSGDGGNILHRDGKDGENESFLMKLDEVGPKVNVLVCCVAVSGTETFDSIANVTTNIWNYRQDGAMATFNMTRLQDKPSYVAVAVSRKSPEEPNMWRIWAIGEPFDERSIDEMPNFVERYKDKWDPAEIQRVKRKELEAKEIQDQKPKNPQEWKEIEVTIISAKSFPEKDKKAPYVKVHIPNSRPIATPYKKNQQNPEWNFTFLIDAVDELKFEAYNHDKFKDELIGKYELNVKELPMGANNLTFSLKGKGGELVTKIVKK
eukprot:TRINITY_DN4591_c0_g1_i1.p1 TRINITY_DN4591_c0_g1~~TRINITY_DN4591_c0_g1_i1.p1  ORF type:complete len:535 (-),score=141.85 TRINITY_DN4591_c0_g1_i1:101-1567(-)